METDAPITLPPLYGSRGEPQKILRGAGRCFIFVCNNPEKG